MPLFLFFLFKDAFLIIDQNKVTKKSNPQFWNENKSVKIRAIFDITLLQNGFNHSWLKEAYFQSWKFTKIFLVFEKIDKKKKYGLPT